MGITRMNDSPIKTRRSIAKRLLACAGTIFLLLLALVAGRGYFAFRDRLPGYSLNLQVGSASLNDSHSLKVGFARVKITPDLSDSAHPIFVAGFGQNRRATGVHDDLWAIACVIDDGRTRLGIVSLDAIGFFHDDVVRVRRRLAADWKLDYAIICSTHNHSTPDLMGLWGPDYLHTGVDSRYRESVRAVCVQVLGIATSNLQPARVSFQEIPTEPNGLVADTRKPIVFDPDIRVIHFVQASSDQTLGSIVSWADHPETPWSQNTELTADYCGYLRDALENGVMVADHKVAPGLGGIHLYINGAIGGLMTTPPGTIVHDPYLNEDFQKPSHEKARALGRQLASRILPKLRDRSVEFLDRVPIEIAAQTIELPLDNKMFLLAGYLGILDRGYVRWRTLRTEVALVTLGEASIACVPGEIYPEIVNGGIEQAPGGDFQITPIEVPPLRQLMPGRITFIFGLANDEVGYLIPKSEWDDKPPYLYGASHRPYGEINSVGPEAASTIHAALKQLCTRRSVTP
ncbi:MAG TPA: hypothetical protein VFE51_03000 [Verrucomicrobiae bacterium]|nr:hypothetical protein [Verrucomicrobiae bacterium]